MPERRTNTITSKPITHIEITVGIKKRSGLLDRNTAAPTSNANTTNNNGLTNMSRR